MDTAADQAIAACGGDAREAVKALIVANAFFWKRKPRRVNPQQGVSPFGSIERTKFHPPKNSKPDLKARSPPVATVQRFPADT